MLFWDTKIDYEPTLQFQVPSTASLSNVTKLPIVRISQLSPATVEREKRDRRETGLLEE